MPMLLMRAANVVLMTGLLALSSGTTLLAAGDDESGSQSGPSSRWPVSRTRA